MLKISDSRGTRLKHFLLFFRCYNDKNSVREIIQVPLLLKYCALSSGRQKVLENKAESEKRNGRATVANQAYRAPSFNTLARFWPALFVDTYTGLVTHPCQIPLSDSSNIPLSSICKTSTHESQTFCTSADNFLGILTTTVFCR